MFGGASTHNFFGKGEAFCSQNDEIGLKITRSI